MEDLTLRILWHCLGTLDILAFTRGCEQLSPAAVEATRKLANVRIHVERIIDVVRQHFKILSATGIVQKELMAHKIRMESFWTQWLGFSVL